MGEGDPHKIRRGLRCGFVLNIALLVLAYIDQHDVRLLLSALLTSFASAINIGVVLAFVYTLNKKKVLENTEILKARRNSENADA